MQYISVRRAEENRKLKSNDVSWYSACLSFSFLCNFFQSLFDLCVTCIQQFLYKIIICCGLRTCLRLI